MELSVWMGVLPRGWPILISVFRAGMASCVLRNIAPISISAALDITALMSWAMLSTAPLFDGIGESLDKNNVHRRGYEL